MVSSREVAELAGVSRAAVSAVLNGHARRYRISSATAERIVAAAAALGYAGHQAGRALRSGVAGAIGITGCACADWLIDAVQRGLSAGLARHGIYAVRAGATANSPLLRDQDPRLIDLAAAVSEVRAGRHDGLVVVLGCDRALVPAARMVLSVLPESVVQVVDLDPSAPGPALRLDLERGLTAAAVHCASLGYRRLCVVDDGSWGREAAACRGWSQVLAAQRLRIDFQPVAVEGIPSIDDTATAVFCTSPSLARTLVIRGLVDGDDRSVVCLGRERRGGEAMPLSWIDPLLDEAGRQAGLRFAGEAPAHRLRVVRSRYVEGASVGPVGRAG